MTDDKNARVSPRLIGNGSPLPYDPIALPCWKLQQSDRKLSYRLFAPSYGYDDSFKGASPREALHAQILSEMCKWLVAPCNDSHRPDRLEIHVYNHGEWLYEEKGCRPGFVTGVSATIFEVGDFCAFEADVTYPKEMKKYARILTDAICATYFPEEAKAQSKAA